MSRSRLVTACAAAAMLASCASTATGPSAPSSLRIQPEQAVMNAAAVAPAGVSGIFEMVVRATGRKNGYFYINSQTDYRDPRNLTIAMPARMAAELAGRFGSSPDTYLIGKVVAVRGTAQRTRLDFTHNGRPTGKYYYQTHVRLLAPRHLTVEGEPPTS